LNDTSSSEQCPETTSTACESNRWHLTSGVEFTAGLVEPCC
jgi:hypothetical protein